VGEPPEGVDRCRSGANWVVNPEQDERTDTGDGAGLEHLDAIRGSEQLLGPLVEVPCDLPSHGFEQISEPRVRVSLDPFALAEVERHLVRGDDIRQFPLPGHDVSLQQGRPSSNQAGPPTVNNRLTPQTAPVGNHSAHAAPGNAHLCSRHHRRRRLPSAS
jgi:hypothetical protein